MTSDRAGWREVKRAEDRVLIEQAIARGWSARFTMDRLGCSYGAYRDTLGHLDRVNGETDMAQRPS